MKISYMDCLRCDEPLILDEEKEYGYCEDCQEFLLSFTYTHKDLLHWLSNPMNLT